jgi:hypothetical protein
MDMWLQSARWCQFRIDTSVAYRPQQWAPILVIVFMDIMMIMTISMSNGSSMNCIGLHLCACGTVSWSAWNMTVGTDAWMSFWVVFGQASSVCLALTAVELHSLDDRAAALVDKTHAWGILLHWRQRSDRLGQDQEGQPNGLVQCYGGSV